MRTYAVIVAGGVGSRMGADIPKQFVEVFGRPVVGYTLESFQRHGDVDEIVVVCIEGWEDVVERYAKRHNITKLSAIVPGGASVQESIRNGVFSLDGKAQPDDIVVVHDSVRPMVDRDVLADVVEKARESGAAVTSMPYNEQIFVVSEDDPEHTSAYIPRETIRRVSTPQAYRFDLLRSAYQEAFDHGIGIDGSHYTNTMMVVLGHTLTLAKGSDRNIKLTTPGDLDMFRSWVTDSEEDWF
ncbi:MAG: 2-C-methyl-D-erythritol 4-phosphate cytidylyltransferase [Atopobiaceae bacterium]|nr:2-C-methyl-D-erythritol 4-phosphate cytidylyltransferase [Atopobiaceae bacterium]